MEKFYLGMDVGTNSVGMSCTDENYRLLRAKGKDCWSVRLFDESVTAQERRTYRCARRRLERRRQRLGFLQALFAPLIEDQLFFIRLNNSQYFPDDKDILLNGDKNTLFADNRYTDKQYHGEFPTIYHLRDALQTQPVTDLRLYYLALHHIIKYRGHFLFEGSLEQVRDISNLFDGLNAVCADLYGENEFIPCFAPEKIDEAKSRLIHERGVRDKQIALELLFGKEPLTKEIIKGLCGGKIQPKILFGEEYGEEKSFSFKELTDEAFEGMQATYGENYALLEKIRAIYSFVIFEKLLEGQPNISRAMIKLYDTHKQDLRQLKDFLRKNLSREEYNRFFKSAKEKANYVNYVGYTKQGGKKVKVKICKDEEFFSGLKKLLSELKNVKDEEVLQDILEKIDEGVYLPKILHSDNGLFPYQVNEDELKKILENMVKVFPETAAIQEKILSLFRFRIPYYVGPLTGKNSWVVRHSDEKITPWNFDEVVDKAGSNEQFMRRMTNKCTYLHGEDVLPQASIVYQKYDVLNQINKLRIDDVPIGVETKQRIYNELFLTKKKVTDRAILDWLVKSGMIAESEKSQTKITGKDGQIKASMGSYIQLKSILGDFVDRDIECGGGVCENIILWHTLNTDKNVVKSLIENRYFDIPVVMHNLQKLKGLSFQKFGRLSDKFLTGLRVNLPGTDTAYSILDLLYETNENLNEILFNEKYNFERLIKAENGEERTEITYADVEELYVSPAIRRGIWQTLCMADEYVQAIGRAPDKIFLEVTREDGRKGDAGRSQSRKNRLFGLYKNLSGYEDILEELQSEEITDMRLRQERLYLYFRQLGRCMYSGERIDLSALNTNQYDVDHILPRSYMTDDSLDNKVLVLRSKNAEKRDVYPLPQNFTSQQPFWRMLWEKGLISNLIYHRLMRIEPLNEDDYNHFINRQKVITDQTVKALAELLGEKYPQTKIVYSKAKNVSDFRNKFDLFKCRETNDLHHARDAYLNVVVGNVFDTCFSTPRERFYKKGDEWRTYNLKTMFTRDVKNAWGENSLSLVKSVYEKHSMIVTRYAYCKKGGFYDQTVFAHDDKTITAPRKGKGALSKTERYGGYKSQTTAYFSIVQSMDKKGKLIKTIEAVPVLVHEQNKDNPDGLLRYFECLGLKDVTILVPKVKCKQLVSYNGTPVYLTGISAPKILIRNAVELFTDNRTDEYVKSLAEFYERYRAKIEDMTDEVYIIKTNRMGEVKLTIDKERNSALYDMLIARLDDKIYSGIGYSLTFQQILRDRRSKFVDLTVAKQVQVLLQILHFFQCNALLSDLSLIGGSKCAGRLGISKNITDVDFKLIHRSPCGLTVRERKI